VKLELEDQRNALEWP